VTDEEYENYMNHLPTTEARIMMALRESRYISDWFPPTSSGAGDMIEDLMDDLREEWGLPRRNGDWWWNKHV
jgi:hypothetical protein